MEKKEIVVKVDPEIVVVTIGLLRGFLPDIIEHLEEEAKAADFSLNFPPTEEMQEVLTEIYEKCIPETDIRELTQAFMKSKGIPN